MAAGRLRAGGAAARIAFINDGLEALLVSQGVEALSDQP
jgi:hypothetical protein